MIQANISAITPFCRVVLFLLPTVSIHLLTFGLYLHPLTSAPTPSSPATYSWPYATSRGQASDDNSHGQQRKEQEWPLIYSPQSQLDELHIMSVDNHDISPPAELSSTSSFWINAWKNDYWGRPLSSESSHKSWRPISVWSFRFLKGGYTGQKVIALLGKFVGRSMDPIFGFDVGVSTNINDEVEIEERMKQQYQQLASELFVHRFINVIIHAAIVQLVGTVAMLLFRNDDSDQEHCTTATTNTQQLSYTKYISQLLFAIHPAHVECVVNAANRPHILALLFNATIVDPTSVPMLAVAILAIMGLLAAETAIFHYPAIALTMTAIRYRELKIKGARKVAENEKEILTSTSKQQSTPSSTRSIIIETITTLLPRYALLVLISATYLAYRYCNDSLSIPDGLIRPAENPYYDHAYNHHPPWTLSWRLINYSYIVSLHIMKSFGVEIVGCSHEYGYDCIPEMQSLRDRRLVLPMMLAILLGSIYAWSWCGGMQKGAKTSCDDNGDEMKMQKCHVEEERVERVLLCLVFLSWLATLFPISGVLKVGTFVADRIVVASTFGTCIFAGRFLALGIIGGGRHNEHGNKQLSKTTIVYVILLCLGMHKLAGRTHRRASEWMDSVPLLESSLKACPRSIKSNLEMSKLYSGLVPHMLDLEKAL